MTAEGETIGESDQALERPRGSLLNHPVGQREQPVGTLRQSQHMSAKHFEQRTRRPIARDALNCSVRWQRIRNICDRVQLGAAPSERIQYSGHQT